jgi:hypothetical protein
MTETQRAPSNSSTHHTHHRNIPATSTFHSQQIPALADEAQHHHHVVTGTANTLVDEFERTQCGQEVVEGVNLKEEFQTEQGGWYGYVEWEKKGLEDKVEKATRVLK